MKPVLHIIMVQQHAAYLLKEYFMLSDLHKTCLFCMLLGCNMSLTGCAGNSKTSDRDVQTVSYEQVYNMVQKGDQDTVIVDVRSPKAYGAGHIPTAINIPIDQLRNQAHCLEQDQQIIVYSSGKWENSWQDLLSRVAAKQLLRMGYKKVYDFRAGLAQWNRQTPKPDDW